MGDRRPAAVVNGGGNWFPYRLKSHSKKSMLERVWVVAMKALLSIFTSQCFTKQ